MSGQGPLKSPLNRLNFWLIFWFMTCSKPADTLSLADQWYFYSLATNYCLLIMLWDMGFFCALLPVRSTPSINEATGLPSLQCPVSELGWERTATPGKRAISNWLHTTIVSSFITAFFFAEDLPSYSFHCTESPASKVH